MFKRYLLLIYLSVAQFAIKQIPNFAKNSIYSRQKTTKNSSPCPIPKGPGRAATNGAPHTFAMFEEDKEPRPGSLSHCHAGLLIGIQWILKVCLQAP